MKISEKSKKMIKETFARYKLVDSLPDIFTGRTILHLYPQADTINDKNDDTDGFVDALLFDVHIYNCKARRTYPVLHHRDEIMIEVPVTTRIFKDGSTMIVIDQDVRISPTQCVYIWGTSKGEK